MTEQLSSITCSATPSAWRYYLELCKPKVVLLMLLTTLVGMQLAAPNFVPWPILVWGLTGIGLMGGAAAGINHLLDRQIDALMMRTQRRPIAQGNIQPHQAIVFVCLLASVGFAILITQVNALTAWLTLATLVGYAGVYTLFLKRATPQNIVIGGLAGATPPLLGWTAVTGTISAESLLLVLIIFTWTPPHFWALAIYRRQEYAKVNIPMLPVTHGVAYTKLHILLYTLLLCAISVLPFAIGMSGGFYLLGTLLLGGRFLYWVERLRRSTESRIALQTFRFSIVYLMLLFMIMLVDHYW
ncbi:MAG: protoheme IX farnesyltransferase [Legionellales bacterium]|nr:protoheme IX farnesyltransferase [Legionellales bacterium]